MATGYTPIRFPITPDDVRTFRHSTLRDRCTICSHPLSAAESLEASYGPWCAKRYTLPHGAGHTAKVNRLIDELAKARLTGQQSLVLSLAIEIGQLGYQTLAADLTKKWGPTIQVRYLNGDQSWIYLKVPKFDHDESAFWEYVQACRSHGLTFDRTLKVWKTPIQRLDEAKQALAEVESFRGEFALEPSGRLFVIGGDHGGD